MLPSFSVIIVMACLIIRSKWRKLILENNQIFGVFCSLFLLNLIEFLTYANLINNYGILIRLYSALIICVLYFFFEIALKHSNFDKIDQTSIRWVICTFSSFVAITIIFSDLIVQDFQRSTFSITRAPGNYYWVFQITALILILTNALLLIFSIKRAKNLLEEKRNLVICYSFIPILSMGFIVLLLMRLDYTLNMSIVMPIGTLIVFTIYLFTESKHELFQFLMHIPFTAERKAYKKLNHQIIKYISDSKTEDQIDLKGMLSAIEDRFIELALETKGGNHKQAAKLLSISLSTMYRHGKANTKGSKKT